MQHPEATVAEPQLHLGAPVASGLIRLALLLDEIDADSEDTEAAGRSGGDEG